MNVRLNRISVLLLLSASALCAADRTDQPIPPSKLHAFTQDMLSGKPLRYGFYGRKPVEWIESATGDEMLRRAKAGELPADDAFEHTSFIYGSYWQNCRKYYIAYRVTGDERFAEQLRQYARLMSWILKERPQLLLPKERRHEMSGDWRALLPHGAASSSMFQGYTLSARLTLQAARADRALVTDAQIAEARSFLELVTTQMRSLVHGDGTIDEKTGLPMVAADIIRTTPYNQSFMYYGVLAVAAAALEDLQHLEGHARHQKNVDLYTRIVEAGVRSFIKLSDVTQIEGRPYVFRSYTPSDPLMTVVDPVTRQRVPHVVDGHPIFRYPEDFAHGQSTSWYLALLWETNERLGVTESLLTGVANAQMDFQLRGKAPLKDGTTGPPNKLLSPWALKARPNDKWDRLGQAMPLYAIFLPFHPEIVQASREFNPRGKKEMDGPEGVQFTLFAQYLQALRNSRPLLHLPAPTSNAGLKGGN